MPDYLSTVLLRPKNLLLSISNCAKISYNTFFIYMYL